ncbi:MAG TPA: radical SAM protein [Candidatus Mailhella merdigallinarum]|uniref:Radical SAM protein n=1 Tax=Candidatus Mailhella merdigallinarum TaxID=2838658 RepID=A0A9D2HCL7_9BACT|nr:radical SAM protein [Candidatus Mailhella merdigallinarum]
MSDLSSAEQSSRNALKEKKPRVFEKVSRYAEIVKNGGSIGIVQFQYNYACNFKCTHCSISRMLKPGARSLTPPDVKMIADQADAMGLAHWVITGGEPLVFPDLDEVVAAVGPERFYISCDTNGFLMTDEKARHLEEIGVDKIQMSLDSIRPSDHDAFRKRDSSYAHAMRCIDAVKKTSMKLIIQTVVTKQRLHSDEFLEMLEFGKKRDIGIFVTLAKPVGMWEGKFDMLCDKDDWKYLQELEKSYDVFTHMTPSYGMDMGCIAVKRMFSITQYGDVQPCPYMHTSLGNVFEEPLADIIKRGLSIKYFKGDNHTCWLALEPNFIKNHVSRAYGKQLPIPCTEYFDKEDFQ